MQINFTFLCLRIRKIITFMMYEKCRHKKGHMKKKKKEVSTHIIIIIRKTHKNRVRWFLILLKGNVHREHKKDGNSLLVECNDPKPFFYWVCYLPAILPQNQTPQFPHNCGKTSKMIPLYFFSSLFMLFFFTIVVQLNHVKITPDESSLLEWFEMEKKINKLTASKHIITVLWTCKKAHSHKETEISSN